MLGAENDPLLEAATLVQQARAKIDACFVLSFAGVRGS